ncbi:Modification methylase Sau96I (M.Sau96I) (Cytosine-specific methyltransferase Sau96I) [Durusdinium trenchii]|uniref:Modification methylase Sau96I (M.Sau96I) (Cytosine-specific methyltransferase Sau96I) n=1 Tax=Durusdinium trenchii TaxID=1381693 RepID=A0ABP0HA27_9DINO
MADHADKAASMPATPVSLLSESVDEHQDSGRCCTCQKPIHEGNSLVVVRKHCKSADIRRCRCCHNLRAAVSRLQGKHGDLVNDFTKVTGDKVQEFYAEHGDLRGTALRAKLEEIVSDWKTSQTRVEFNQDGEYMDETDLAKKYEGKPETLAQIMQNTRKYFCPVRQQYMYCDPRYSERVQSMSEVGTTHKRKGNFGLEDSEMTRRPKNNKNTPPPPGPGDIPKMKTNEKKKILKKVDNVSGKKLHIQDLLSRAKEFGEMIPSYIHEHVKSVATECESMMSTAQQCVNDMKGDAKAMQDDLDAVANKAGEAAARLKSQLDQAHTMVGKKGVCTVGGSPPQPNDWASLVPCLGSFPRRVHVSMPCCGIDGCGTALQMMSVPFKANNVMDVEARYGPYLEAHLPGCAIHVGHHGDVNSINIDELERPVDLLCSGPPCPPWAGNGSHGGQMDMRAEVFLSVVRMVIALAKSGELKAAILENARGICNKLPGQHESFLDQMLFILRQEVPEFHWDKVELSACDYLLAQQRTRIFLRGLRTTIAAGIPAPLSPFGRRDLSEFLDHGLEPIDTSTLTEVMRKNLEDAEKDVKKMVKAGTYKEGDIIVIPLDRSTGKVYQRKCTVNIVPTLTTTNRYLFITSVNKGNSKKGFHRSGNAYPVPLMIAVLHPILDVIRLHLKKTTMALGLRSDAYLTACANFDKYMNHEGVQFTSDKDSTDMQQHTIGTKLALLSKRCALLGLTSPSEPTYVMCIAILVLASHQECADEFTYEVSNGFGILSDFKHVLKNVCKGVTHSGLQVYPDDPAKLPDEIKKHAYQEGTPAKCPLDIMTLQRLCNDLPARRTHTAVSGGNKGRTSTRDESFKTWFADMLMRGMANGHGKQYNALPGFMMLDHKQTKTGKAPQLALEDGDEETQEEQQPKVIPAQAKAIDAMAAMIGDQLAQNKNNKKQKKAEDCDDEPKAKKQKNSTEEKKPETETTLSFPGIKKRDPMRSGVAVIYTCPNSSSWRVKKEGEKKDKSFSWKGKPAKEVWPRVVDYVRKLK